MEDNNNPTSLPPNWQHMSEVERLRFTIARFKEYDKKRKGYIIHLQAEIETLQNRISQLESLTERQHNEIDELIAAYESARPLIADPSQKAYIYQLLERIETLKKQVGKQDKNDFRYREWQKLKSEQGQMEFIIEENKYLKERVTALEKAFNIVTNGRRNIIS